MSKNGGGHRGGLVNTSPRMAEQFLQSSKLLNLQVRLGALLLPRVEDLLNYLYPPPPRPPTTHPPTHHHISRVVQGYPEFGTTGADLG